MLAELTIENLVLVDHLSLEFGEGMTVLTGETGAGKSILLDALGLSLGKRADSRFVRAGCERAEVCARFDPPARLIPELVQAFESAGVAYESGEEIVMRRQVGMDGRSRGYINDRPASLGLMRSVGECLVEIQGQNDRLGLLDASSHAGYLDRFGNLGGLAAEVRQAFQAWKQSEKAWEEAVAAQKILEREREYLRHARDELEEFEPLENEESTLNADHQILRDAARLTESLRETLDWIEGDGRAESCLHKAMRSLARVEASAGQRVEVPVQALERASQDMADAVAMLTEFGQEIAGSGDRLSEIEERLFRLRELARKYGCHPDELDKTLASLQQDLEKLDSGASDIERLDQQRQDARAAYSRVADELAEARSQAAQTLADAVNSEFPSLKLEKARFSVARTPLDPAQWGAAGKMRFTFEVSTNPGVEAGPIEQIASGGELARILLALKVSLAGAGDAPTLIFDEVDSGISGATAAAVGQRMAQLARHTQVLAVTHSPQVAARGQFHWLVAKENRTITPGGEIFPDDGDGSAQPLETASTRVSILDDDHRHEEIARMLAGSTITKAARDAAHTLLAENG